MIPYIHWTTIQLGPLTIYVWGLFVAAGVLLGVLLAKRAARRGGVTGKIIDDLAFWMLLAGFAGARLGYVFFYNPHPFLSDPLEIFRVWHGGLSSIGGFIAALAALAIYLSKRKIDAWQLSDALAAGFPLGWAVGRIGCFFNHLHPGRLSQNFLAVSYPGGSRWDLGLIESVTGILVWAILIIALRVAPGKGTATLTVAWSYLGIRFFTDFLRATDLPGSDPRFLGLTPAQYGAASLLLFVSICFTLSARARKFLPSASTK